MAQSDGTANALTIVRIFQILTLIPCWAILAALVSVYNSNSIVAPAGVLCLFIVALLASIWAFCVLLTQLRAHNTAIWMAIGDIAIIAGLIAGVVLISRITARCVSGYVPETVVYSTDDGAKIYTSEIVNPYVGDQMWNGNNNHCDLAKAAMGLGIANIIFFFISAILAIIVMMQNKKEDEEIIREKVYTRRGSRQYARRPRSHRHRHRHRDPRSGEYIVEERIV